MSRSIRLILSTSVLGGAILAAGGLGWWLGKPAPVTTQPTMSIRQAEPVPATSPSLPWTVLPPCTPEPGDALSTSLDYQKRRQDSDGSRWRFLVPQGWIRTVSHADRPTESVWVPPNSPGYQLRTWITSYRLAPSEQADWQTDQMMANYPTARQVRETESTGIGTDGDRTTMAFYSFRTSGNACRLNYFGWVRPAGMSVTPIEVSVSGRTQDSAGLEELLRTVMNSFEVSQITDPDGKRDRPSL